VLETGRPLVDVEVEGETLAAPGVKRNWLVSYYPVDDSAGNTLGVGAVVVEITGRKAAEAARTAALDALQEQHAALETVSRVGRLLSAELDLKKLVQAVTDAATELSGAQFGAFFYNVEDAQNGHYTLYTLSGVPAEAFSSYPMPRATEIFAPTFRGEGTLRLDDVRADPRYGKNDPYVGLPAGHLPVVSYLAVSVVSRTGEVLGGLFFGHERAGVFDEGVERVIEALAAQAAVAMDNARLFGRAQREIEERRKAEEALKLSERQTRVFLRDILASVTEGRLRLCDTDADLPAPLPPAGEPFALSVRSLSALRRCAKDTALAYEFVAERWQDLETAVGEAAMNAVVHAGGGEGHVCASPDGRAVQVWVRDRGSGIAVNSLHRATLERGFTTAGTMGHGFWLMLKTCDRVWLLTGPGGTTVVLEQEREAPPPAWLDAP
jgi:anti-sigma regulatory factor (Ser/Thr protein kinase)